MDALMKLLFKVDTDQTHCMRAGRTRTSSCATWALASCQWQMLVGVKVWRRCIADINNVDECEHTFKEAAKTSGQVWATWSV